MCTSMCKIQSILISVSISFECAIIRGYLLLFIFILWFYHACYYMCENEI